MGSLYTIQVFEDDDSTSPYEEFEKSLTGECLATAVDLRRRLASAGTRLPKRISHDVGGGIWELKGRCPGGGVRIYYWQSGLTEFTLVCGELKVEDDADEKLIQYAKDCYEKSRPQRRAKPPRVKSKHKKPKRSPARGRKTR